MQCSEGAFGASSAPMTCSPNADTEVERSLQKGFTQDFKSCEDLVAELGPDVVVNKLGCTLKVKISGDIKERVVTDLRRPGGNNRLKTRERVVPPRVLDLGDSTFRLGEYWGDITLVELAAIDFSDAFHTIFLRMASAPCASSSPQVLPHLPAVTRQSQCTAGLGQLCRSGLSADAGGGREYESHCYVDDPGMAMAGSADLEPREGTLLGALALGTLSQRCQGKAIPSHLA